MREAAKLNASDIHLQPTQGDQVQVRLRIDGELLTRKLYTSKIHEAICRVIIENNCGLTLELNAAQDGKFDFAVSAHKKINLRVSTLPVTKGSESTPKVVVRLLGNDTSLANLDRLGMSAENKALLRRLGEAPNGLIIVTGPTGSGKTTTLNAMLLDIYGQDPNRNYHTIEEPVEIQHEGMSHTECGKHLSFATALRALLRQDPDVILLGEIRDNETAEYAFKAGQTGHLVLTTLHTNNAHESLDRLGRMDIPTDIIATNTQAIMAQRLVRSLCKSCKVEYLFRSDEKRFALYGSNPVFGSNGDLKLYRANPKGCQVCNNGSHQSGGLKGRRGVIGTRAYAGNSGGHFEWNLPQLAETLPNRRRDLQGPLGRWFAPSVRRCDRVRAARKELRPYLSDRVGAPKNRHEKAGIRPIREASTSSLVAQL